MDIELKPCPFCGKPAAQIRDMLVDECKTICVICDKCNVHTQHKIYDHRLFPDVDKDIAIAQAVKNWNTRSIDHMPRSRMDIELIENIIRAWEDDIEYRHTYEERDALLSAARTLLAIEPILREMIKGKHHAEQLDDLEKIIAMSTWSDDTWIAVDKLKEILQPERMKGGAG